MTSSPPELLPPELRRRRIWVAAAWILLVAGAGGSLAGSLAWDNYQAHQAKKSFNNTAAAVASAVNSSLSRSLDFNASMTGLVVGVPLLTNRELGGWFQSIDITHRYRGTVGFVFVEKVTQAQLPTFVADLESDPPINMSLSGYAINPPGPRAQYCLLRLGIQVQQLGSSPTGLDYCATLPGFNTSLFGAQFKQAAAAGGPILLTAIPKGFHLPKAYAATLKVFYGLYDVVTPVYTGNVVPATVAARQNSVSGFLIGTFSVKTLFTSALGPLNGYQVGIQPQGSTGKPLFSGGAAAPGGHFSLVREIRTNPSLNQRFDVVVTGSSSSNAFVQGLLLGAGGIILSIVLFMFLIHLARSRESALRLVEERTGQLRHQALHDSLTGLPNRALIFDRAQQLLARAKRQPLETVGALYLDIDNFKDINDTFGHQVGDQLLKSVAVRLASALRDSDTVGRIGGDEFVILVEGDRSGATPELVAERLGSVLLEPFILDAPEPVEVAVRASIGVAVGTRDSADELFRDADVALYRAKAAGKDRCVVFLPEMQTAVQDRMALEMDLRNAIRNNELFLVYQPIFDLNTLQPKGAEALVRWRHPTKGIIPPLDFIPLAEESGLIVPIGQFVLNSACSQAAAWRRDGYPIDVSINVSPRQLEATDFVTDVRVALEANGIQAKSLTLEITETTLMRDTDATARILRALKSLGVHISIDDFGTGYSSLAYLRQFPIDSLKIDRSFITMASENAESGALMHTLIQLGKALGIETLAEGIEEQVQLAQLQREHCDSGQGFLFARPLAPDDIVSFFTDPMVERPVEEVKG